MDNWEKAKSEKSEIEADKTSSPNAIGDEQAFFKNGVEHGFRAGAEFGRAYSQGEVDNLFNGTSKLRSKLHISENKIDQLTKQNAELQAENDILAKFYFLLVDKNKELQAKYDKALNAIDSNVDKYFDIPIELRMGMKHLKESNVSLNARQVLKELGEM